MELFIFLFIVYSMASGAFCAYLASEKGRDGGCWFFTGLLFGIIALLTLVGLPRRDLSDNTTHRQEAGDVGANAAPAQLCPHCVKEIRASDTLCLHCYRNLPEVEYCALGDCGETINPEETNQYVRNNQGIPFCSPFHAFLAGSPKRDLNG